MEAPILQDGERYMNYDEAKEWLIGGQNDT